MADGNWSYVETDYDGLGRKLQVSTLEPSPHDFTKYQYDVFGRPTSVTGPDGSISTISYLGDRQVVRTNQVATDVNGGESPVVTTETYDTFARLREVVQPSGLVSPPSVLTVYGYDVGNRLASVNMSAGDPSQTPPMAQTRTFQYDNRGFLKTETHPELGAGGNGSVYYLAYDARGHLLHKVTGTVNGTYDLAFAYDAAERLTLVLENVGGSGRTLKAFTYGTSNNGSNYTLGKRLTALRNNYLTYLTTPSYGTIAVTEAYTYDGRDGAASVRETKIEKTDIAPALLLQDFTTKFEYNELGLPKTITYPSSLNNAGANVPQTVLTNSYANGFLTSVGNFATLSYATNGTLRDVKHGIVNDHYEPDATGLTRPQSIRFTGWQDCPLPSASIVAPSAVCASSTSNVASVTPTNGATYTWSITGGAITTGAGTSSITFSAPASGSFTLAVAVSNTCGNATSSQTIVAAPFPNATVTGSATIPAGGTATIQAVLTGTAPWSLTWSDGVMQSNILTSTVTRSVTPSVTTTYSVTTVSSGNCSASGTGSATVTVMACSIPSFSILGFGPFLSTAATGAQPVQISVIMNPPDNGNEDPAKRIYQYQWQRGDGSILGVVTPSINATTGSFDSFRVQVTLTDKSCSNAVTSDWAYVLLYGTPCPLPPVAIAPATQTIATGHTGLIQAVVLWPDVTFQWYRGESGDTHLPLPSVPLHHDQLAVSDTPGRYWVRVSNPCGQSEDSTAAFASSSDRTNTCDPLVIHSLSGDAPTPHSP